MHCHRPDGGTEEPDCRPIAQPSGKLKDDNFIYFPIIRGLEGRRPTAFRWEMEFRRKAHCCPGLTTPLTFSEPCYVPGTELCFTESMMNRAQPLPIGKRDLTQRILAGSHGDRNRDATVCEILSGL